MRHRFVLSLAVVTALLIAGCGGGKKSSSASSPTTTALPQTPLATNTTAASTGNGVIIATKHAKGKLGTILAAGPKHMTVYLWGADKGSKSSCTGACAQDWPPVTSTGAAKAAGAARAADLGTTTRPDGSTQVTYKGHPLYFFGKDGDAGDAYGQGSKAFGADWYVLAPSGNKVDTS